MLLSYNTCYLATTQKFLWEIIFTNWSRLVKKLENLHPVKLTGYTVPYKHPHAPNTCGSHIRYLGIKPMSWVHSSSMNGGRKPATIVMATRYGTIVETVWILITKLWIQIKTALTEVSQRMYCFTQAGEENRSFWKKQSVLRTGLHYEWSTYQ